MAKGFLYLVAIIDWASRAVLAWRLSNTMDTAFCLEALQEALARWPKPAFVTTRCVEETYAFPLSRRHKATPRIS